MDNNNYCVILAGGLGKRFWPFSRKTQPKQFLDICGVGKTLLQLTFERVKRICPVENIYVVTTHEYKCFVYEQLPNVSEECIVLEPFKRNTAPAIAYVNNIILKRNVDANIILTPSDHLIFNESEFYNSIEIGLNKLEGNDVIIDIGVTPTRPSTSYDYIQYIDNEEHQFVFDIKTFTEKPSLDMAKMFIKSDDFLWNTEIYIYSLSTIIKAFHLYLPDINSMFAESFNYIGTSKEEEFIDDIYSKCENISIQRGVFEKADNVKVLKSNMGWTDLGTWKSLYQNSKKDENENLLLSDNIIINESKENIIKAGDKKLVVVQGLENFIVADTEDVLFICDRNKVSKIREILNEIKQKEMYQYL